MGAQCACNCVHALQTHGPAELSCLAGQHTHMQQHVPFVCVKAWLARLCDCRLCRCWCAVEGMCTHGRKALGVMAVWALRLVLTRCCCCAAGARTLTAHSCTPSAPWPRCTPSSRTWWRCQRSMTLPACLSPACLTGWLHRAALTPSHTARKSVRLVHHQGACSAGSNAHGPCRVVRNIQIHAGLARLWTRGKKHNHMSTPCGCTYCCTACCPCTMMCNCHTHHSDCY